MASAVRLLGEFPNLVVTRTFSKGYGLAGLRVGYALGDRELIAVLNRLRESFNVNAVGLLLARLALDDSAHLQRVVAFNHQQRGILEHGLQQRGVFVHPSMTNFLLADFGQAAAPIEARWLQRGVVVRPMGGYGLPTCLRISVGSVEENARLLATVDEALAAPAHPAPAALVHPHTAA